MQSRNRIFREASDILRQNFGMKDQNTINSMVVTMLDDPTHNQNQSICDQIINCNNLNVPNDVRTYDGRCNNLQNPLWGSANSILERYLPAQYRDPFGTPKGGFTPVDRCTRPFSRKTFCSTNPEKPLPNPRWISTQFHSTCNIPDNRFTHMLTQFGQFLDHDFALSPEAEVDECLCRMTPGTRSDCFSIQIPCQDPFHRGASRCMHLTRSVAFCEGRTAVREQV